jgi:hypothetical protein
MRHLFGDLSFGSGAAGPGDSALSDWEQALDREQGRKSRVRMACPQAEPQGTMVRSLWMPVFLAVAAGIPSLRGEEWHPSPDTLTRLCVPKSENRFYILQSFYLIYVDGPGK